MIRDDRLDQVSLLLVCKYVNTHCVKTTLSYKTTSKKYGYIITEFYINITLVLKWYHQRYLLPMPIVFDPK